METNQVVVNHNTRVTLKLPPAWLPDNFLVMDESMGRAEILEYGEALRERCTRVVAMMDFLEGLDFQISAGKDCMYADSIEIEAKDVKRRLIDAGFHDQEFQILLEYTRKWGML